MHIEFGSHPKTRTKVKTAKFPQDEKMGQNHHTIQ
jgi:hypothetical protein